MSNYLKLFCSGFHLLFGFNVLLGQDMVIDLYDDIPPFSTGIIGDETWADGRVSNVQLPQMYVFKPAKEYDRGVAAIFCPGGGYGRLAMRDYGKSHAKYFNEMGITAIILKYRLPISENVTDKHKVPLSDAKQAIKKVRSMAEELEIDPRRIVVMGSSAGGHLAGALSTQYDLGIDNATEIDAQSSRPDFTILIYPVVSMDSSIAHSGSRRNLLGNNPDEALVKMNSNEHQVTPDTPPTFIVHGTNDSSVSVLNSVRYYEALVRHNVPVEMHIFEDGKHGSGFGKVGQPWSQWKDLCKTWLERNVLNP